MSFSMKLNGTRFLEGKLSHVFLTNFPCGVNRHLPVIAETTESHPPKFYVIKNKTESIATL